MDLKELKMILQTPTFLLKGHLSDICKLHSIQIVKYPFNFFEEDNLACFIFDFYNFPFDVVKERFEKEGGKIIQLVS